MQEVSRVGAQGLTSKSKLLALELLCKPVRNCQTGNCGARGPRASPPNRAEGRADLPPPDPSPSPLRRVRAPRTSPLPADLAQAPSIPPATRGRAAEYSYEHGAF